LGWDKTEKAFRTFFPEGTTRKHVDGWIVMPSLATDVFAFAAHLIERGGIYHRVIIEKTGRPLGPPWTNGTNLILRRRGDIAMARLWESMGREA
jgi:hypothetical protein